MKKISILLFLIFNFNFSFAGQCLVSDQNLISKEINVLDEIFSKIHSPTIDIYNKIVKCNKRIWSTSNVELGNKNVYFYDTDKEQIYLRDPNSKNLKSATYHFDKYLEDELSNLSGYTILPGSDLQEEALILNDNSIDIINKMKNNNQDLISFSQKTSSDCNVSSNEVLPPRIVQIIETEEEIAGFCMHEDFHLFQRNWKDKIRSEKEKLSTEDEIKSLHYWERINFYLLKASTAALKKEQSQIDEFLSYAKFFFEKMKNELPYSLELFDDKFEGTAQYVEIRSRILFKEGCAISDEYLNKKIQEEVTKLANEHLSLAGTSYVTSAIASSILDIQNIPSWKEKIEKSEKTPTEILFLENKIKSQEPQGSLEKSLKLAQCIYANIPK